MKQVFAGLTALLTLPGTALAATTLPDLQQRIVGQWVSISCEIRPQANPTDPAAAPLPTYLTRDFTYDAQDGFSATIVVYADPICAQPLIEFSFAGEIRWHGPNPAAEGAWSQDYVLNQSLELTPRAASMVKQLSALPKGACGDGPFKLNEPRDILGVRCALLRYVEGSDVVVDHDLLYVPDAAPNMLFMGAKHVDGTGFYVPENRPTVGLQQPLLRVAP